MIEENKHLKTEGTQALISGLAKYRHPVNVETVSEQILSMLEESDKYVKNDNIRDRYLTDFITSAYYDDENKDIVFCNDGEEVTRLKATPFIKDGMVQKVEVIDDNLVITFNTEAEQEPISMAISDIFDANNYYNKSDIEEKLTGVVYETTSQTLINKTLTGAVIDGDTRLGGDSSELTLTSAQLQTLVAFVKMLTVSGTAITINGQITANNFYKA